jgi:putative membrane protein insertion efficiency factor
MTRIFKILFKLPRFFVLNLFKVYMRTFSPDHGWLKSFYPFGYCRFWPSCSVYSFKAVEKYGVFRGVYLACRRIFRCNPWNKGGIDELK